MDNVFICVEIAFCLVLVSAVIVEIMIQFITVTFFDNVPSVVKVDDIEVYRGTSAGFDVENAGYNTTVTIYGGFLYLFPQEYYTSQNVEIFGQK